MKLGSPGRAIIILAGSGVVAFAGSTAAVSLATTSSAVPAITVKYHFTSFTFTGAVSTSRPSRPQTFSLNFTTSFALAANSPGIVNKTTGTLDPVTVEERVSYPVPGGRAAAPLVGPVQLPFSAERLALIIVVKGSCLVPEAASGDFVFHGSLKCVSAELKLGGKTYRVGSLLRSVSASFAPPGPASGLWTGTIGATFANPGYTFPVATLGSGGGTSLIIGSNGGSAATQGVSFTGTVKG